MLGGRRQRPCPPFEHFGNREDFHGARPPSAAGDRSSFPAALGPCARARRQVHLAPLDYARRPGLRRDAGHRPARGRGRHAHRRRHASHGRRGAKGGRRLDPQGHRQRRLAGAGGAARLRQCRHRLPPHHGPGRHLRHAHHLRRRRVAVAPADGPRARPAPPDGRAGGGGRTGRPHAAHLARAQGRRADRLPGADGVGPGQVGSAAGRPQHAGHHHRRRAGHDPRPYREDAARLRRRPRGRDGPGWRAHHPRRGPGPAGRPTDRGSRRPVLRRLSRWLPPCWCRARTSSSRTCCSTRRAPASSPRWSTWAARSSSSTAGWPAARRWPTSGSAPPS